MEELGAVKGSYFPKMLDRLLNLGNLITQRCQKHVTDLLHPILPSVFPK